MKSIRIRKNFSISSPQKIASAEYPDGKEVFVTSGMRVLTKGTSRQMIPCEAVIMKRQTPGYWFM